MVPRDELQLQEAARRIASEPDPDLAEFAAEHRRADQAHLIR